MNESFLLKYYGHYSIWEQNNMTAEERAYLLQRIDEEAKKSNTQESTPPFRNQR
jgi:hypothetical protein